MLPVTQNDLARVLDATPGLCAWGMGSEEVCLRNRVDLAANREILRSSFREFKDCCEWLSKCELLETANEQCVGSYGLKHIVEFACGDYVSNGALIAAVIHLGIPFKGDPDSPNIKVAISSRCPVLVAARMARDGRSS